MEIRIEERCPQCGAPIVLKETDHLLTCPFCEVKNLITARGPFRYYLPPGSEGKNDRLLLQVPYLRFKGTIFLINEAGIGHKVVDTTRIGTDLPDLPPTLGVRPQAMPVRRLIPETPGRFLPLTIKASAILEKVIRLTPLRIEERKIVRKRVRSTGSDDELFSYDSRIETTEYSSHGHFLHRAFIGETISFLYLPLEVRDNRIVDAVTVQSIIPLDRAKGLAGQGRRFRPSWKTHFRATLCPRCGWSLDGEGDALVMTCSNCDSAWSLGREQIEEVRWRVVKGTGSTRMYIGFWRITGTIPEVGIASFADFIKRTNQPMLVRPEWNERPMRFLVPAFKLQPKIFLRIGRQATISQWRLQTRPGRVREDLYPVTLPASEARQSVKVILAACAASRKRIFPFLPQMHLRQTAVELLYLPFEDKGHDWYQPDSGISVSKNTLRFGRRL